MVKISIIVSSFNKSSFLPETIDSVLSQTFKDWELIIVDDGSTDNSKDIIRSYVNKDSRIVYFLNEGVKGANSCRNLGIEKSTGLYVVFLDADDVLMPFCLESRWSTIENNNFSFDIYIHSSGVFQSKIGDRPFQWIPKSSNPLKDFLSHNLPWLIMQPIWKKEVLLRLNGFDLSFTRLQDVELHTRALFDKEIRFLQIPNEPDCYYRIDEKRKNFDPFNFLSRQVESTLKYYHKFIKSAKNYKINRYLFGTVFKTYMQLLYSYKINQIDNEEFKKLEGILIWDNPEINFHRRVIFKVASFFFLLPIRLPGINFLLNKLVVL